MADRSVVVKVGMNVTGLVASARVGTKALQDMGSRGLDWVGKNEQKINAVANGLGVLGLAAVAGVGMAVKKFADFDQQMSYVAATGDDARQSIDALRQAAIDAGADTAFSAGEAAQGIEELAKAGVSAADILAGGLTGALDLAAAGGIGVGEAAETAATAMTQFGLAGDQVTHLADLLAAGAGKAQGGVSELGMALKQAGLVADQTGLSIEETVGGLTAFAAAGLLGSDAGTSFKSMLQRLTPQSKEAEDEMRRLGISAYDAQGQFIGLEEFAGNLQAALRDLTPEQRNAAMATIFGSDAVRAAAILYDEGEQGIRDWIAAVDDQGYAAETAATRLDNLKGDIEALGGSIETALIGAGEGANGPLRQFVQSITDAVNKFNELPDGAKTALTAIVGGGGLVALGVAGMLKLVIGINKAKIAFEGLGLSAGQLGRIIGKATFWSAAIWGATELGRKLRGADVDAEGLQKELERVARGGDGGPELDKIFGDDLERLGESIDYVKNSMRDALDVIIPDKLDLTGISDVRKQWESLDDQLAAMVEGGNMEGAGRVLRELTDAAEEQGKTTHDVQALLPGFTQAWDDAAAANSAAQDPVSGLAGVVDDQAGALDEAALAAQAASERLAAYIRQIAIATDPVFALNDAVQGVTQAQNDYNEAVKEYGPRSAEAQDAAFGLAAAVADLEAKALAGDLSFDAFSDKLDDWVAQGAITKDQADSIRDRVEDLTGAAEDYEGSYEAQLKARDEATAKIQAVQRLLNQLNGRTVESIVRTIHEDWYQGSGVPGGLAAGGLVAGFASGGSVQYKPQGLLRGPGSGTSDSIPVYASNGEYIVKASSVDKYGVGFMDAVNNGHLSTMAGGGGTTTVVVQQTLDITGGDSDLQRLIRKWHRTGELN